jgi:hypothetical protein
MKVKYVMFFYNHDLLSKIIHKETETFTSSDCDIKDMRAGDLIKLTGMHESCIVKFLNAGPKDCNGCQKVHIQLVKIVLGELEIDY